MIMSPKACKQSPFELVPGGEARSDPSWPRVPHEVRPRSESNWCEWAVLPDDHDDSGFQTFVEGAGI
jgi:hypothetical protein